MNSSPQPFSGRIEAVYQAYQATLALYQQQSQQPVRPEWFEVTLENLKTTLDELRAAYEEIEQQHQLLLESQQQLEAERHRYQELFNLAPDGYLVTDAKGIIQEANVAIATMLRVLPPYLIGKPLILFFAESDHAVIHSTLARLCQTAPAAPLTQTWEARLSTRRDPLDVAITLSCSLDPGGTTASLRWLIHDITRQKQAEAQIQYQACHDALTGLPNRALLDTFLPKTLAQAQRHQTQVAIAFVDLDRFKGINDTFGHGIGDQLLQQAGQRLAQCLRAEDLLVRWGGDEFIVVLAGITQAAEVVPICDRLIASLQPAFHIKDLTLHTSTSFGVAFFPDDGQDPETLLHQADQALYQAKSQGRNTYRFYRRATA